LVTATSSGTVTITATNTASGKTASKVITIYNDPIYVTGITVTSSGNTTVLDKKGKTCRFTAKVTPSNANDKTIVWSVINGTGTATIDQKGLLKAVSNGSVTVKATNIASGVSATMTVNIINQDDIKIKGKIKADDFKI